MLLMIIFQPPELPFNLLVYVLTYNLTTNPFISHQTYPRISYDLPKASKPTLESPMTYLKPSNLPFNYL